MQPHSSLFSSLSHHLHISNSLAIDAHNKKAAIPARMAPALTSVVAAPPVKGVRVGDTGEVVLELLLPPVVPLPVASVKFAQVKRVVLVVWMTMERLPKKDSGPEAVER